MITVKPLCPELFCDYIDFFENRAFTDNKEWAGCYCMHHHRSKDIDEQIDKMQVEFDGNRAKALKEMAKQLLEKGTIGGFLAYENDKAIGFCNANDSKNYYRLYGGIVSNENEKVMSIVCITVDPTCRRKGIATRLINATCENAREKGYSIVEAYGVPKELFLKSGFEEAVLCDDKIAIRKFVQK